MTLRVRYMHLRTEPDAGVSVLATREPALS